MTLDADLMRVWITGDLHGRKPIPPKETFDAIICPGDFGSDAAGKHMFEAVRRRLQTGNPRIHWYDVVGKRAATAMVRKSISDGRAVLQYLDSFGVPVYVVPGNWDWTGDPASGLAVERTNWWPSMLRGLRNVTDVHARCIDAGAFCIIGYGKCFGPEIPQYADDRALLSASSLRSRKRRYERTRGSFDRIFARAKRPVLLLTHNVPYNTPLDMIDNPASPRNGRHYGSLVARDLIREHRPLLAIGGHMHEHYRTHVMGKTIALNTGFGPEVQTMLEISDGRIRRLELRDLGNRYRRS